MPFTYDGVHLLAMLDEYKNLKQEKEEEKRRMRVLTLILFVLCLFYDCRFPFSLFELTVTSFNPVVLWLTFSGAFRTRKRSTINWQLNKRSCLDPNRAQPGPNPLGR